MLRLTCTINIKYYKRFRFFDDYLEDGYYYHSYDLDNPFIEWSVY